MSRIKSYRIDGELISHDELRITNISDLQIFLLDIAQVPNEIDEVIYNFIYNTNASNSFQLSGDGDGLGFILDVWNNHALEGEPIESLQIWFDEYKEFM